MITTLLAILIVVEIVQTSVVVYFDIKNNNNTKMLENAQATLRNTQEDYLNEKKKFEKALASHKLRTWMPTGEQMSALYALCYLTNKTNAQLTDALTKLYQDLKREFYDGHSFENMDFENKTTIKECNND